MTSNVLICEDNKGQRMPLGVILGREGHRAVFAASLQAARELLDGAETFTALVTDVHLPDGNGLDLLAEVRARHPDMTIIVVTGDSTQEIAQRAAAEGARAVLPKPLDYAKLIEALR